MGALLSSHKDGLALSVWWGAELNCSEWEKSRRVRSDRCLDIFRFIDYFRRALLTLRRFSGENNWHRMQNYMQHNPPALHLMSTIQQLLQHHSTVSVLCKKPNNSLLLHGDPLWIFTFLKGIENNNSQHRSCHWTLKSTNVCISVRLQRPCSYKVKPFGANTAIGLRSWRSSGNPWSNGGASPRVSTATQSHKVCIYTYSIVWLWLNAAEFTRTAAENDVRSICPQSPCHNLLSS